MPKHYTLISRGPEGRRCFYIISKADWRRWEKKNAKLMDAQRKGVTGIQWNLDEQFATAHVSWRHKNAEKKAKRLLRLLEAQASKNPAKRKADLQLLEDGLMQYSDDKSCADALGIAIAIIRRFGERLSANQVRAALHAHPEIRESASNAEDESDD